MPLLSILIPAYNAEDYLPRCLDSICCQGEEEFEIVVVDDGSTDSTLAIAQHYARTYKTVRVTSKSNEGVGATRNRLLQEAHGKYIWFVDADDYVFRGSLAQILASLKENVDIDMITLLHDDEKKETLFSGSGEDYVVANRFDGYLWSKVIRREVIVDGGIQFDAGLNSQEDWLFLLQIYPLLQSMTETSIRAYCYCDDNGNSVMRLQTRDNVHRNVDNSLRTICHFSEVIARYQARPLYAAYRHWLCYTVSGFLFSLLPLDYSLREVRQMMNCLRQSGLYPSEKCNRRKADLFLSVANHEWLYLLMVRLWRKRLL